METERLLIRPLTGQDTEALYAVLLDREGKPVISAVVYGDL